MADPGENLPNEGARYILFEVGNLRLATPLLSVREIVEPIPYQTVSNPHPAFLGLANLRGQIIGVLDFGSFLKVPSVDGIAENKMIIFDGDDSKLGILVNSVYSPIRITSEDIISERLTEGVIPPEALLGIAKVESTIIPIVSLAILAKTLAA